MRDGALVFREAFLDGLRPKADLLVSEWANQNLYLSPKFSNWHGKYESSLTPYCVEIMDNLSVSSPVEKCVWCAASQVSKSTSGHAWVGYVMDHAPAPMLVVLPRKEDAQEVSQIRIDPMIAMCPALSSKVAERREKGNRNKTYVKEFPGGVLKFVGTNSAMDLRMSPARNVLFDEIDEYVGDVGGEGDPVELVLRRTATFRSNRKLFMVSSPTIEGRSRIWNEYEATDRRVYLLPCPVCGEFQWLLWKHIKYETDKGLLVRDSVTMECEHCLARSSDSHKTKMLAAGFWAPRNPERPANVRGYHTSALYSPIGWYSWADAVQDFLEKKSKPDKFKVWVNTVLAEPFRQKGDAPDWERLYERREKYPVGVVPPGALFITIGADVQRDRIEYEVIGWGRGLESWSIDYVVLPGKTNEAKVWADLSREMQKMYPRENGLLMPVQGIGIDSGDGVSTADTYRWVRGQQLGRVFALKGTDDRSALVSASKHVEVQFQGKRLRRGIMLWLVGGPVVKNELYAWLRLAVPKEPGEPYPAGFCHFPDGYGKEHFEQLTAEEVVKHKTKEGYATYKWEKIRERNERLDCRVYGRAAAYILGIDRFTDAVWESLEATLSGEPNRPPAPAPPKRKPKPPGGYLSRFED